MPKNKKKVNPRRKPCTEAEANKKADEAFYLAIALMMDSVIETEKFNDDEIIALWDRINYKSDSVAKGYVSLRDIVESLEAEYGITIGGAVKVF